MQLLGGRPGGSSGGDEPDEAPRGRASGSARSARLLPKGAAPAEPDDDEIPF